MVKLQNGLISKPGVEFNLLDISKKGDVDKLNYFLTDHSIKDVQKCLDSQGHTPLHWACLQGHTNLVTMMIDQGANITVKAKNEVGKQPIHWACANGHLPIISLLLKAGADVNALDNSGATPFLLGCQFGHTLLVNYLINKGADVHAQDNYGNTGLHWSAFRGHEELCSLLIYFGLNPNKTDYYNNNTLHLAAKNGGFCTFENLINRLHADYRATNSNGETVLSIALKTKNNLMVRLVREKLTVFSTYEKLKEYIIGPPGKSTLGLWFFLVNVLFWGYPMYIYHALFDTWLTIKFAHISFFLSNVIMWTSFFATHYTDPGFTTKNSIDYDILVNRVSDLDDEIRLLMEQEGPNIKSHHLKFHSNPITRLCHSCRSIRPLRSKHCRKCHRCVLNFDHHCPYVRNCIGIKNRPYFFLFAISILFNCILGFYITHTITQQFGWTKLYIVGIIQLSIFLVVATSFTFFMLYYILWNLTTNEIFNYKRYRYLHNSISGKYKNPFDEGVLKNIVSYFKCIPSPGTDEEHTIDLSITNL